MSSYKEDKLFCQWVQAQLQQQPALQVLKEGEEVVVASVALVAAPFRHQHEHELE
jgi:hypothetical protein